ncbi:MAG: sugar ABC transporter permease [Caldilineaceae bacterium]|nr:sugar ABC transporter permease [Caldilineaceae bacterium]
MTIHSETTQSPPQAKPAVRARGGPADRQRTPWEFILPALVPLFLITIGPLIFLYYISMTDYELGTALSDARWVGLDNYARLFSGKDPQFWSAVVNTIWLAVVATAIELVLGFGIALLVDSFSDRMKGLLVAILMLPMVVTPVIVGLVWKLMMNSEHGVINWLLGHFGMRPAWLGPDLSLASVMIVEVWQWTPFAALILLAGLSSLPTEPHEAAAIDGASGWQSLIYVTLPLLMPVILLAALLRLIDVLKIFDVIFIMTGGGPGSSTETLAIHSYRLGFYFTGWIGRASATAVVLAILTTAVAIIMIVRLQRVYQER